MYYIVTTSVCYAMHLCLRNTNRYGEEEDESAVTQCIMCNVHWITGLNSSPL